MSRIKQYRNNRIKRKIRTRGKIFGTLERPRLSVFRSSKHIYAQVIDDVSGSTIASISDVKSKKASGPKSEIAFNVGKELAKAVKGKKIEKVIFDRNGYKYHGRVKKLVEGVREGGIEL